MKIRIKQAIKNRNDLRKSKAFWKNISTMKFIIKRLQSPNAREKYGYQFLQMYNNSMR